MDGMTGVSASLVATGADTWAIVTADDAGHGDWIVTFRFDGPVSDGRKLNVYEVSARKRNGAITPTEMRAIKYGELEELARSEIDRRNAEAERLTLGLLLEPWRKRAAYRSEGDYAKLAQAYESALNMGHRNPTEVLARHSGSTARVMANRIATARRIGMLTPAKHGVASGTATELAHDRTLSHVPVR